MSRDGFGGRYWSAKNMECKRDGGFKTGSITWDIRTNCGCVIDVYITFTVVFCRGFYHCLLLRGEWGVCREGVGGGNLFCGGECVVDGSHFLQVRMIFARSVTGFAMHPRSLGHGLPPKVRQRAMRRKIQL